MSKKKKVKPTGMPSIVAIGNALNALPPVPLQETEIEYSDGSKVNVMLPSQKALAAHDKKLKKILQPLMDMFNPDVNGENDQ